MSRGNFTIFADGIGRGYEIDGQAVMTRTLDGKTIVVTHATGLASNLPYMIQVHNKACSDSSGGGHYQNVVGGTVDPNDVGEFTKIHLALVPLLGNR